MGFLLLFQSNIFIVKAQDIILCNCTPDSKRCCLCVEYLNKLIEIFRSIHNNIALDIFTVLTNTPTVLFYTQETSQPMFNKLHIALKSPIVNT